MTENPIVPIRIPAKNSWWLPLSIILGLGLAITAGLISSRSMMMPPEANPAQLNSALAGTTVEVAVKVTAVPSADSFDARLLEEQGSGYKLTNQTLHFRFPAGVTMMMGQRSDVRIGAILSVNAVTDSADKSQLEAKRVVILTGYAAVD